MILAAVRLPIHDPVLIFAIAMFIFVSAPLLFERFRVPGIIGLIVAGAVVGPNGLGLLARDDTIVLLGTVGLLYLMFLAGVELDLNEFNRYRNRSLTFGAVTFVLPQLIGTGLGLFFGYSIAAAILLGALFASHTLLAYPIASRLGIGKNEAVTAAVGSTIVAESLALLVLAVVAASAEGALDAAFWARLGASMTIYVAAVMLGLPRLGRWFFRQAGGGATAEYIFVLAALFTTAFLAELAELEPIIGAFLAGLVLNRLIPEHGPLMNRLQFFGNAFFIPFFLLSVGMLVDVQALSTWAAWAVAGSLAVAVTASKWISSEITERIFHYTPEEGWVMFGLTIPHASGTLAIALVGYGVGLFDQTDVNAVVLIIVVTSLLGPWAVEKYGRRVALAEEQKPYDPGAAPQRILIPISNPATAEDLLDLAFIVHGPNSDEPLHPLTVVRETGTDAEAQVAEAEKMLGHAVIHAAGAEVPMVPLTRVDQNIATGITRGIAETRSSTVIIGWNPGRERRHGIFGSTLDQLLDQTKQLVLVAKLGHSLNTTQRLVLVLPSEIDHHPGFFGAVRTIKTIASQLGGSIHGLVIDGDPDRYRELYEEVKPEVPVVFEAVARWRDLSPELDERLKAEDLVVVMSARRGTIAWHPELERLPQQLVRLAPESFLIVYPSEVRPAGQTDFAGTVLPRALLPERVVFSLEAMPFEDAIRDLLRTAFIADSQRLERITRTLVGSEREFSTEISPGVVIPHARVSGLPEPMMFLGISSEGVDFPRAKETAHLIFLLLSPADRPQDNLKNLAEVARLVSNPERVEDLLQSRTPEDLFRAFRSERVRV